MKIMLITSIKPVQAKLRRYSNEQRKILSRYIIQKRKMGFHLPSAQASRVAALLLVSKASPSIIRTITDLGPFKAATITEIWPIPDIEAELSYLSKSQYFTTTNLCTRYWQSPLNKFTYDACDIITPVETFLGTKDMHCLEMD